MVKSFKTKIKVKINNKIVESDYFDKTIDEINELSNRDDIIMVSFLEPELVEEYVKEREIFSNIEDKYEQSQFYYNRTNYGIRSPKEILEV